MENIEQFLYRFKQNDKLPIRMASPGFGHLSPEVKQKFLPVHRAAHYFFLFMIEGSAKHQLDLQPFEVNNNELLFILPNQIHELPTEKKDADYFKIGFDESCLSMLPRQYPFLVNPLNNQKIKINHGIRRSSYWHWARRLRGRYPCRAVRV